MVWEKCFFNFISTICYSIYGMGNLNQIGQQHHHIIVIRYHQINISIIHLNSQTLPCIKRWLLFVWIILVYRINMLSLHPKDRLLWSENKTLNVLKRGITNRFNLVSVRFVVLQNKLFVFNFDHSLLVKLVFHIWIKWVIVFVAINLIFVN